MSEGLARLSSADLEALRELIGRGRLRCPISRIRLAAVGLERLAGSVDALAGKDAAATTELLDLLLAERRSVRLPVLDLVWTGPEATGSATRSTTLVVREMFERAQRTVVVAGFSFDDPEILRPLHAAMVERGVQVRLFVNVPSDDIREVEDVEQLVREHFTGFLRRTWPFGGPWPELYYDPRQTAAREFVSLHAKCVVVDEREALLTSANFTSRGHARNIELGVRIEDPSFARAVAAQWHALVAQGLLVAAPI
ncbi:MAG: DISARM system phospholipase D-like protein DrmC [Enhygromyxa sp.]